MQGSTYSTTQEFKKIFSQPLAKVKTVYATLSGNPPPTDNLAKVTMSDFLARQVFDGHNSIETIIQAIQDAPYYTGITTESATTQVANRANDNALSALSKIASLETSIVDAVRKLDNEIVAVRKAIPTVETDSIEATVNAKIADAFKPFISLVIENKAETKIAQAVALSVTNRVSALDLFGIDVKDRRGNPLMIDVYTNPDAPSVDNNFVWTETILRHLALSQETGEPVWFGGEKGTGKTQTAEQWCAKTGRAFTRINFHKYTTASEYIGDLGADQGTTSFKPGAFLMAFTTPGAVILLDEVSMCPPGELAPLNGLLEPNSKVTIGGQVWRRAPGVMIIGADNTLGSGDDTGRYDQTNSMNSAFVDRFARVIKFEHMTESAEIDAVVRHTACDTRLAEHVVQVIRVARSKVTSGDLVDAPSIRSVLAFIRALNVLSVDDAWQTAIANRQPVESATALEAIRMTHLNDNIINSYL